MTRNAQAIGVSFPRELIEKIDGARGDVTRSRFILRMVEKYYLDIESKKKDGVNKKQND